MGARSSQSRGPGLNKTDGHLIDYFRQNFSAGGGGTQFVPPPPEEGIQATGGFITDYEDPSNPGTFYRSHLFTSTGTFTVTQLSEDYPAEVEYVVVAGGGGAGGYGGSPATYRAGVAKGSPSIFDNGGPNPIPTTGGGTGGNYSVSNPNGPGGSGGGGAGQPGPANGPGSPGTANQGYAGGTGYYSPPNFWRGSGGGGAGSTGYDGGPDPDNGSRGGTMAMGGDGIYTKILNGVNLGLAGGGSGGGRRDPEGSGYENVGPSGPYGGGGGGFSVTGENGLQNTGGGGGGGGGGAGSGGGGAGGYRSSVSGESSGGGASAEPAFTVTAGPTSYTVTIGAGGNGSAKYGNPGATKTDGGGGDGGSGVVIVRYRIGGLTDNVSYKATGGQVYQWTAPSGSPLGAGSKTVHVFLGAGSFKTGPSFSETVEYFVLGGGGGGGAGGNDEGSGGGGAGGVSTGTLPLGAGVNYAVTVGAGGLAGQNLPPASPVAATPGGDSTFGSSITGYGGGKGANGQPQSPDDTANNGGSGGGGGAQSQTAAYGLNPSTPAGVIATFPNYTPGTTQGYDGAAYSSPDVSGGGGGGAGGVGTSGATAHGGIGVQLPATFQNPAAMPYAIGVPGPGSPGLFWVGGGGGGGQYNSPGPSNGRGGGPGGPYAGGGDGGNSASASDKTGQIGFITAGKRYTGGGGGGAAQDANASSGGAGIVLIAYPT